MKIGYARVSTRDQNLHLQIRAMKKLGCEKIFRDHGVSGGKARRPGLDAALATLTEGDVLVVWKLDRLGRSLQHLIEVVIDLRQRQVDFQSITESIDTTTATGRLTFHLIAALAEFQKDLISENTIEGMRTARGEGKHVGRPRTLAPAQIETARREIAEQETTLEAIAAGLSVHPRTLTRALKRTDYAPLTCKPESWE